jgi:hypothetical protein
MGKFSRDKGKRNEYSLRDYLRLHGWQADRVPSSGAAQGFKGDIKAAHPVHGPKLFELKARKETFKRIYELYAANIRTQGDDVLAVAAAVPGADHVCVRLSSSLPAVIEGSDHYEVAKNHPLYKEFSRTFRQIGNLEKLLGEQTSWSSRTTERTSSS